MTHCHLVFGILAQGGALVELEDYKRLVGVQAAAVTRASVYDILIVSTESAGGNWISMGARLIKHLRSCFEKAWLLL